MVATPDDVAELFLARGPIEKPEFFRPDLIENDATGGGFDRLRVGIAINCLLTEIGILNPDTIVCLNRAIGHGELHLGRIGKKRKALAILFLTARVLRQVITTQGNVLRRRRDRLAA